jgi:hypothetical protein
MIGFSQESEIRELIAFLSRGQRRFYDGTDFDALWPLDSDEAAVQSQKMTNSSKSRKETMLSDTYPINETISLDISHFMVKRRRKAAILKATE